MPVGIRFLARSGPRRFLAAGAIVVLVLTGAILARLPPRSPRDAALDSLTADRIEAVRRDPARALPTVYADCREEIVDDLGAAFRDLAESDRQLIFCCLVAHALAPYGPSEAITLPDLLAATHLNCGNYPLLMARLFEVFDPKAERLVFIGWAGGAVGHHGMAYRWQPAKTHDLFLDPTVGIVVRADFDTVASGRSVRGDRVVCFTHRDGDVAMFRWQVSTAFLKGQFRPSDLFYFFEGADHMTRRAGPANDWPTPGAMVNRGSRPSIWE
jgi:hypothetical protein